MSRPFTRLSFQVPVWLVGVAAMLPCLPLCAAPVDYARDVQPIFAARCYSCHGPEKQKSGLRLDRKDAALHGGDSNRAAIVPGKSAESLLFKLVTGAEGEEIPAMPPKGDRLSPDQVDVLRRWIDEGAVWPEEAAGKATHWAFVKPVQAAIPEVAQAGWARNPIDNFVLARLEKEGLKPSPEADRNTLLRRVSLDLIGLPPTPAELRTYLADSEPGAYERAVERLLVSPRYGERWARPWLDIARYADTNGYEKDKPRKMWIWRDWVIDALNKNMPFDEFTIEQLAGDLLPNATEAQRIATGFHRNTMLNDEGGIDAEEFRMVAVIDRVNTTAEVWMGLTMGCAQCHTHKFDPITHTEYYRFFAFFNSTEDNGRDPDPRLMRPSPEQGAEIAKRGFEIELLEERLAARSPEFLERVAKWEANPEGKDKLTVDVKEALAIPREGRDPALDAKIEKYFRGIDLAFYLPRKELDRKKKELADLDRDSTMVLSELPQPRVTNLLRRGDIFQKGEEVTPGVPAVLPPMPEGPANRLALARWLVSAENPLTARVTVNRAWGAFFDKPLVATPNDFGTRGDAPSHPELLDWLAVEFQRTGWDMKALHRFIVTSAAYRQSSRIDPAMEERDPYNTLLARGPRHRVEGEMVRDIALAAGGLLSPTIGGPSVYPPQPPGIWEASFSIHDTPERWIDAKGDARHRRGLYTYWRRTAPYPEALIFDAPRRDVCVSMRARSNTPLQSLVTLNSPVYVEAAAGLARRMMDAPGGEAERLRAGFEICLSREPSTAELERLAKVYAKGLDKYSRDAAAANAFLAAGGIDAPPANAAELAAMMAAANVLLNLDETITKG